MSYFGDKLQALMETNKVTGMDITRATKINSSQVSRWISGENKHVSEKDMGLVARTACKTKIERAELIAAYLKDKRYGPGADLVEITVLTAPAAKPAATRNDRLFDYLRQAAIEKPMIKKLLLNLATHDGFK